MADRLPIVSIAGEKKELPASDTIAQSKINSLVGDLALKAPLASPVFTGISDFSTGGAYFGTAAAANLLDDYEEGTWTPSLTNIGTGTYTHQLGQYTKIGRLVTASMHIDISTMGTASGSLIVAGLPFAKSSQANQYATTSVIHASEWSVARSDLNALLSPSGTTINIYYGSASTTPATAVIHADIGTGSMLFTITYEAA
jgi:hypothetical protein